MPELELSNAAIDLQIDRYLATAMEEPEVRAFEALLQSRPEVAARLQERRQEKDAFYQRFTPHVFAAQVTAKALEQQPTANEGVLGRVRSAWSWRFGWGALTTVSLAAVVLLLVGREGGEGGFEQTALPSPPVAVGDAGVATEPSSATAAEQPGAGWMPASGSASDVMPSQDRGALAEQAPAEGKGSAAKPKERVDKRRRKKKIAAAPRLRGRAPPSKTRSRPSGRAESLADDKAFEVRRAPDPAAARGAGAASGAAVQRRDKSDAGNERALSQASSANPAVTDLQPGDAEADGAAQVVKADTEAEPVPAPESFAESEALAADRDESAEMVAPVNARQTPAAEPSTAPAAPAGKSAAKDRSTMPLARRSQAPASTSKFLLRAQQVRPGFMRLHFSSGGQFALLVLVEEGGKPQALFPGNGRAVRSEERRSVNVVTSGRRQKVFLLRSPSPFTISEVLKNYRVVPSLPGRLGFAGEQRSVVIR